MLRSILLLLVLTSTHLLAAQTNFKRKLKAYQLNYKQSLIGNENAPLDSISVRGVRFFRPKQTFQVVATFAPLPDKEPFEMPTYTGQPQPHIAYGKINFVLYGDSLELTLYRNLRLARIPFYRDRLFLPFKDQTNQSSTYGGGRYLDLQISEIQDGSITIDFNKAYNPYCAYGDGYSCPIPPLDNHLPVKVKAGEKGFKMK